MKSLCLIALTFILVSCSTITKEQMQKDTAGYNLPYQAPKGEGIVYVIRPSRVGMLVRFNVFLDDQKSDSEMGWNRGSEYIYFFTKPGEHKLFSVGENTTDIHITVKEDKPTFVRQDATRGFIMARNSLQVVEEVEGTYHVKNLTLGTVLQERKKEDHLMKVPETALLEPALHQ